MATIAENLHKVINAKSALMTSINAKNEGAITNSTPFSAYPSAIDAIEVGGIDMSDKFVSGCLEIKDYTDSEFLLSKCVTSVNIPESVTSLGNSCFSHCSNLAYVTIPNTVTSLGTSCFSNCSNLTYVNIPDGVRKLDSYCFFYCSSLAEVTIPNAVASFGSSCFEGCASLSAVTIPNAVTSLGIQCFRSCKSLSSVTIPYAVTSIGSYCFYNCSKLKSVTCKATTPPTLGSNAFDGTPSTIVIYVPAESVDAYKTATNWSNYADKIQAIA